MSLKTFHIFFIVLSTLLCIGFGVWSIGDFSGSGASAGSIAMGVGSFSGAVVLMWYGVWFLRKLKNVSFL